MRSHFRGLDLGPLVAAIDGHTTVTTGEQVTAQRLPRRPAAAARRVRPLRRRSATGFGATNDGERASAIELALEGLYLARRICKETGDGETVYG